MVTETTKIWKEFSGRLRRFIIKRVQDEQDAEDILQDVFCKIHNCIHQLEDQDKLQAWVYQITRNAIIDYYRQRKVLSEPSEMSEDWVDEPVTEDLNNDIVSCLKPMIDHLPDKYRQILILTEFQGLTQKQAAGKIGLSLSGAKSRAQRAREELKEMLFACCHFELDRLGNILDYQPKDKSCRYCAQE